MTDKRDIVNQAISNKNVIHIVYRSYQGSVTARDITPLEWVNDQQFRAMCHLAEPYHSPRYYEILDRVLPDWRERRDKLNAFEFG
jgi:predicted DNA-binding transcriptional regulator YafY